MGWEYHNRERNGGKWRRQDRALMLTVRCTVREYETIRGRAYANKQSMSEYVRDLVQRDCMAAYYGIKLPADGKKTV